MVKKVKAEPPSDGNELVMEEERVLNVFRLYFHSYSKFSDI